VCPEPRPASSAPSANAWTAWTPRSRRPCDAPASGPGCRRGAAGPPQADRSWAPAAGSPRCGGSVVSGGTGVRAAAWRACTVPSALLDGHRSTGTRCSCGPGRRSAPTSPRLPVSLFDVVYLSVEHAEIYIGRSRHWGGVVGMVSLVAEINRARQRRTAGQQYTQLQFAGRCGDGVSKPGLLQDGDGTGDRTGWPAVIRGRHEQYRSGSTPVKASAAGARTGRFGSGVLSQSRRRMGDGAGCRSGAVRGHQQFAVTAVRSSRLARVDPEGRTEEPSAIRIARAEVFDPGAAGHR
jgi:hypothetical protein